MWEATIVVPCFNEAQRLDVFSFGRFALTCDRARLLFPMAHLSRAKDHNRAEALLLAHYGRVRWQTRVG